MAPGWCQITPASVHYEVPSMLLLKKCAAAKDSLSSGLLWVKKTLGGSAGLFIAKLLSHCNGSCQHSLIAGTISTVWVSSKMEHSVGVLPQQLGWYGSTCSPEEFPSGLWTPGSAHTDSGLLITCMEITICKSLEFVLYGLML